MSHFLGYYTVYACLRPLIFNHMGNQTFKISCLAGIFSLVYLFICIFSINDLYTKVHYFLSIVPPQTDTKIAKNMSNNGETFGDSEDH